ncbi:MAG: helix-turn-helix domain-containing protein [Candidatus Thiodiazotropha sp.]|jgi:transcriptional regulator with XRE-family HTH domain
MIKKIRITKGWSQEQLAQFSGLSVRTIQRIERGHNAGLESLKCIAAVFDMDVSKLQNANDSRDELFLGANPILPVTSVHETAKFFEEKLGFEIEIIWHNPPYAVVARDRTTIEFGERRQDYAGTGICVIFVSDADVLYHEYSNKGVEFFGDIADREYGSRDFRVKDNNGNLLIFSSPLINKQQLIDAGNTIQNRK